MKKLVALLCLSFAVLLPVTGCVPFVAGVVISEIVPLPGVRLGEPEKMAGGELSSSGLTGGDLPPCPGSYGESAWFDCYGTLASAHGDKYVGEWRDNKRHGQGTYFYIDGAKYVGEWRDNKRHGQGTYAHTNGDKYVGEFKNSKRHGQGTYTHADGRVLEGIWKNGCLGKICPKGE